MKKSVILVIIIIYILSIALVGFLGLKMKVYNPVIYAEKIECVSENYKDKSNDPNFGAAGYISVKYTEGVKVELRCKLTPDNVTHKDVEYNYTKNDAKYILTKNPDGTATIEFFQATSVDITVQTMDGRGTKIIVRVIATDSGQFF